MCICKFTDRVIFLQIHFLNEVKWTGKSSKKCTCSTNRHISSLYLHQPIRNLTAMSELKPFYMSSNFCFNRKYVNTKKKTVLIKPFHDSFWVEWERTGFIFSQITQFVSQCLIIYPLTHGRKTLTMKLVNSQFYANIIQLLC